jgi:hypothetical protein
MNREYISSQINKVVCEAVGCSAKAVEEIRVTVGQQGYVPLMVCSRCKEKFAANTAETREASSQDEVGA